MPTEKRGFFFEIPYSRIITQPVLFVSSNLVASGLLYIFNSSSGSTISFSVYRWVTFLVSESYSATILPPSTGVLRSMHLSVQISYMMGMIAWKKAWNASVLFFFFVILFFFASFRFLFFCALAYALGSDSFLLVMNAFCCIFHCFENFPLTEQIIPTYYHLFIHQ